MICERDFIDLWNNNDSDIVAFGRAVESIAAQEAARQEREACLAAVAGVQEKEWYGHDNPYIFEDGKQAAVEAIRSRSS
jgi:hypothetical protein